MLLLSWYTLGLCDGCIVYDFTVWLCFSITLEFRKINISIITAKVKTNKCIDMLALNHFLDQFGMFYSMTDI